MTVSMRPGGLTTLAVLNFLVAAWSGMRAMQRVSQCVFVLAKRGGVELFPTDRFPPEQQKIFDVLFAIHPAHFVVDAALLGGCAFLAVVSGVGYLKQRRVLGFWIGIGYCGLALVTTTHRMSGFPTAFGGGVTPYMLLSFFYPSLSLIVLTTTFRKDLRG